MVGVTRTVASARGEGAIGLVLSPAEATVLLSYANGTNSRGGLRAAYGPLLGHWSAPRTISGRWSVGFTNGIPWPTPHLALAPDGTVLAAWDACRSQLACAGGITNIPTENGYRLQRLVVAWRAPGRPFGAPTMVSAAPLSAVPQFDAAGTAYLASPCGGSVAIAPAQSRRFRRTIVTRGAAQSFTLALSGAGQGVATWVAGACSYSESSASGRGPVLASVLRAGTFATPIALTPPATGAFDASAVAVPGGVTVSWSAYLDNSPNSAAFSVQIDPNGVVVTTQQAPTTLPLAADGGGDVLLEPVGQPPSAPGVFVRPAGGGSDQPGPAPLGQEEGWAVAPAGRVIALIWASDNTTLELSVWLP